jgi:hypothetical protein
MNLAPTTWAWVRRIAEIAPTVLWALAAAGAAIMIMYFPRILEARATIERQRAQEITEENRAYCEKWGLKAGTHEHTLFTLDLQEIRAKVEQRIADDLAF